MNGRASHRFSSSVAGFVTGLLLCGVPALLEAQRQVPFGKLQLVGTVRDASGAAIDGVSITMDGMTVRTNARGGFELFTDIVDTATIIIRGVGYEPVDALLTTRNKLWDTVLVQLQPTAQQLRDVTVNASMTRSALGLRNFEERRARGIGTFITRADIVERGSSRLSDLMRIQRGVNVVKGGRVRFAAYGASRGNLCQPDIWLDGRRSQGMELDDLPPNTVEAIELYPNLSTVPVEFQAMGANTTPCGTIVVWTRIPNDRKR